MQVIVNKNNTEIYTPYNASFVKKIKLVSGSKWDSEKKCWNIDPDKLDIARNILEEVYGFSDISTTEKISVKLTFNESVSTWHNDVVIFGKTLSHARHKYSGGFPGDDVTYIKEQPQSGGSFNDWYSVVPEGAVVILENVSKKMVDEFLEKDSDAAFSLELIEKTPKIETLVAERETLMQRINEIDEKIAELKPAELTQDKPTPKKLVKMKI